MSDKWMDDRDRQRWAREGRAPQRYGGDEQRSFDHGGGGPLPTPGAGPYGAFVANPESDYRGHRDQTPGYTQSGDYRTYQREYAPRELTHDDGRYGARPSGVRGGYGYPAPVERGHRRPAPLSGGTGGYDYELGYGDGGRGDEHRGAYRFGDNPERAERFEEGGRAAGEFLHRAGEKVASWLGDHGLGHRGRGPKGYKRSDARIEEDIHDRLTEDPYVDASEITLGVSSGEVTLTGAVDSREAKHRAEHIAEAVSGVDHVQNNLRVARPGEPASPLGDPGAGKPSN